MSIKHARFQTMLQCMEVPSLMRPAHHPSEHGRISGQLVISPTLPSASLTSDQVQNLMGVPGEHCV